MAGATVKGRDFYLTPSPEGLQLLAERRDGFEAALAKYHDIMKYPSIQRVVVPGEEDSE